MSTWDRWIYVACGVYFVAVVTVTAIKEWRKTAAVRAQCERDIAEARAQAAEAIEEARAATRSGEERP